MADGGAGTAGSKRVRKTAPRFEVDEGRQMGVRDSRSNATNAVPAPASTQAAPHQEGGLVPVSRFLARSLLALSEMQKWHKRVCGGRGVSPDGERTQCECCPREDVLRLDNVVRAVQGTLAAASALPELVGDEGSLQPVEYFVSRETFVALEQAVGGRLELDPSRGGRPASMAKLGKRADELLQVLLPKALGSLPIILSYAGQGGSADAGHCGAGPSGQPSTPATVERPARGAPVTLEQACIATACVDDKPCAFVNHDRSFCAAVLDEVREVAVESVRKHLAARPPGFRHVDDCVRRVLDGEWRAVLPDEKWMHQLLLSMMPALKPGDDNGRARSEARASAILASLVYMHDRRLNHYQLVWAIRCRTTGTSPKMQALLSAHGLALPRRTADTYLSRLCDLLTKRQAEDRRNAGPLIWVVDNYEYMFWKRFLSGALSLYQCATQQDKERLAFCLRSAMSIVFRGDGAIIEDHRKFAHPPDGRLCGDEYIEVVNFMLKRMGLRTEQGVRDFCAMRHLSFEDMWNMMSAAESTDVAETSDTAEDQAHVGRECRQVDKAINPHKPTHLEFEKRPNSVGTMMSLRMGLDELVPSTTQVPDDAAALRPAAVHGRALMMRAASHRLYMRKQPTTHKAQPKKVVVTAQNALAKQKEKQRVHSLKQFWHCRSLGCTDRAGCNDRAHFIAARRQADAKEAAQQAAPGNIPADDQLQAMQVADLKTVSRALRLTTQGLRKGELITQIQAARLPAS
jgi:hypothetical protein